MRSNPLPWCCFAASGKRLTQGGTSMLPPTVAILALLAFVIALAALCTPSEDYQAPGLETWI